MQNLDPLKLFVVAISIVLGSPAIAQRWEIKSPLCKGVIVKMDNGSALVRATTSDPQVTGEITDIGPKDVVFEIEYTAPTKIDDVELYVGPPISAATKLRCSAIPASKDFGTYSVVISDSVLEKLNGPAKRLRLDIGRRPGTKMEIRSGRFRPLNDDDRKQLAKAAAERQLLVEKGERVTLYKTARFDSTINQVAVDENQIALTGQIADGVDSDSVSLEHWPIWQSIADGESAATEQTQIQWSGRQWRATVPRRVGTTDRLHSGWRLASKGVPISARRYATDIKTIGDVGSRERRGPSNQKGLGGVDLKGPIEEIPELGVTAITINMLINSFVTAQPGPDRTRIESEGDPIFFNPSAFARYDKIVAWARQHDIVVTAILLIGRPNNKGANQALVHPDADGGAYAMPDLTTPRGASVYGEILNQITSHYRDPNSSQGGIDNWIAHNEIDHHYAWTNMGRRPRPLVTETYYRSMRMIHNAAVQYNPHATVFASLTHHWSVEDDGNDDRLAPKEVLVDLQRLSIMEGDFRWGVGYHPYPTGLRNEIAWDDPTVKDDHDTEVVSLVNLEVLMRFLSHRLMRDSKGVVRTVLLSEQGFDTNTYSEESQRNQAASLVYAMKRIAEFPSIESFHYHRWIDHPTEGGLKMGLRTLPKKGLPYGEKKLSWDVYRAIGTDAESKWTADLPRP